MARVILTDADMEKFATTPRPYPDPDAPRLIGGSHVVLEPIGMQNRRMKVVLPIVHWAHIVRIAEMAKLPLDVDLNLAEVRQLAVVLGEFDENLHKVVQLCQQVPGLLVK